MLHWTLLPFRNLSVKINQHINKVINEGLQNNNTKPFWNYAKSKREDNIGIAPLKSKGQLISDPKGRAEILIDQFVSVFSRDKSQDLPEVSTRVENDIPLLSIGEEGVFKLLQNGQSDYRRIPQDTAGSLKYYNLYIILIHEKLNIFDLVTIFFKFSNLC